MFSVEKVTKAWCFTSQKHMGQTYGGITHGEQVPYIDHLASVAFEFIAAHPQADNEHLTFAVQCAILHDSLEDTDTDVEELTSHFGHDVSAAVSALSKNASISDPRKRMEDSIERIKQQPPIVWSVKLADRITNLYHPPFYWDTTKIRSYKKESVYILTELGSANETLATRLQEKIVSYQQFE